MAENIFMGILSFFKIFGLVPYWTNSKQSNQLVLQKVNVVIMLLILLVYWLAVIQSFWTQTINENMISKVSNWMQLIINALSFTTILLRATLAVKIFKRIHSISEKIDAKLSEFSIKINRLHLSAIICVAVGLFSIYLAFLVSFDCYVNLFKYNISSKIYWTITIFPMIIYSASICYAICLFTCIYFRIQVCNKILKHEIKLRFVHVSR